MNTLKDILRKHNILTQKPYVEASIQNWCSWPSNEFYAPTPSNPPPPHKFPLCPARLSHHLGFAGANLVARHGEVTNIYPCFLCVFVRSQKATISFAISAGPPFRLPTRPNATARLTLGALSWKFILATFIKYCAKNSILVKFWQKYQTPSRFLSLTATYIDGNSKIKFIVTIRWRRCW